MNSPLLEDRRETVNSGARERVHEPLRYWVPPGVWREPSYDGRTTLTQDSPPGSASRGRITSSMKRGVRVGRHRSQSLREDKIMRRIEALEKYIEIKELINLISGMASSGLPLIVEGKRDIESLRELGISGNFIAASSRPPWEIAERAFLLGREALVLTDLDEKGEEIAKEISRHIEELGGNPHREIREKVLRFKKDFTRIEDMSQFVRKLEERMNIV